MIRHIPGHFEIECNRCKMSLKDEVDLPNGWARIDTSEDDYDVHLCPDCYAAFLAWLKQTNQLV